MNGEECQNIVFRLCQVDFVSIDQNLPFIVINHQILKLKFTDVITFVFLAVTMTAKNCADTSHQFLSSKRLGNVIIRAKV